MRVLVIEDQQSKSAAVCRQLLTSGEVAEDEIVTVMDVSSAKRELRQGFFELAVIDIAIPRQLDGDVIRDAGLRLVEELFGGSDLHQPMHVFGLTGFADLASRETTIPRSVFSIQYFDEATGEWRRALALRLKQIAAARKEILRTGDGYDTTLGIVCALDTPELSSVLDLPWAWTELILPADPTIYYEGTVRVGRGTRKVVAAASARMGLTAAAVATVKIINAFRPRLVAMVGIAAGVPNRAELGDVILADPVWDWGSGKWTAQDDVLKFLPSPHQVDVDPEIRNRFRRMAADALKLAEIKARFPGTKPKTDLRLRVGPLSSGAAVLADGVTVARILEQNRDLIGVDMEGYGVLAAALECRVPRAHAFVIKGIVDFANVDKSDSFQAYAAYCSANVLRTFIEDYAAPFLDA